jgi:hypothetical protein
VVSKNASLLWWAVVGGVEQQLQCACWSPACVWVGVQGRLFWPVFA